MATQSDATIGIHRKKQFCYVDTGTESTVEPPSREDDTFWRHAVIAHNTPHVPSAWASAPAHVTEQGKCAHPAHAGGSAATRQNHFPRRGPQWGAYRPSLLKNRSMNQPSPPQQCWM
eukprot:9318007-Ditylum_brightwellii.AAC.1